MSFNIRACDLGLTNDRLIFSGSSPVDAVAQVVIYLQVEYGLDLPEAHIIFRDGEEARWVMAEDDVESRLIVALCPEDPVFIHNDILRHLQAGVCIHLEV